MIICLGTTPTVQRTMTFARLEMDAVNRASAVHQFASGKSMNAARVAHALGEAVLASGFAGGEGGRFIREDLDRSGIAHDFVEVEPPTRLCLTVIDESRGSATELIEESSPVPREAYEHLLEKLGAMLPRATALVLSGTLPPQAPQQFYADCLALAGGNLATIVDAKGEPLAAALERRPLVVKPNRAELGQTLDAHVDDEDAVRSAMKKLITRGARWALVTAGIEPALLTDGAAFWKIHTPAVRSINPIGSGDALAGGMAVGLVRGKSIPESCVLGIACAAANAMTPHAGHLRPSDVQDLIGQVRMEQV